MASALQPGSSCLHCCCCSNYLFILKAEFLFIVPKNGMRARSPTPQRQLVSTSCVPSDVLCALANACTSDAVQHLTWPSILQVTCQRAASFRVPFSGEDEP